MSIRILDLDNCIAHDAWRIPLIDWAKPPGNSRYTRYHQACHGDVIGNRHLTDHPGIVIFTGRPLAVRRKTEIWLHKHGVRFKFLLMRNNDDESRSVGIKLQQLRWLETCYGIDLCEIDSAFDDRPDVVEMYKTYGIPAEQAKLHDVSAYASPEEVE